MMPVDQQPYTTVFYEVHVAAENEGKVEVHILKEGITYDVEES
jgi:mitofusin